MSDEGSQASPDPIDQTPAQTPAQSPAIRPGVILLVVLPVALLLAVAGIFFGLFDGVQWLSDALKPARVSVVGRVVYNGEPLSDAIIETRPIDGDLMGAIGAGDDQGQFKLLTQIRGDFLDGAYAGEHQVTVKRYDTSVMAFGPPPLLTPSKYASFNTSPLRINIEAGQAELVLELNGQTDPETPADPRAAEYSQRQGVIEADAADAEAGDAEAADAEAADAASNDPENAK